MSTQDDFSETMPPAADYCLQHSTYVVLNVITAAIAKTGVREMTTMAVQELFCLHVETGYSSCSFCAGGPAATSFPFPVGFDDTPLEALWTVDRTKLPKKYSHALKVVHRYFRVYAKSHWRTSMMQWLVDNWNSEAAPRNNNDDWEYVARISPNDRGLIIEARMTEAMQKKTKEKLAETEKDFPPLVRLRHADGSFSSVERPLLPPHKLRRTDDGDAGVNTKAAR